MKTQLSIRNLSAFADNEIDILEIALIKIQPSYNTELGAPIHDLLLKVTKEKQRRIHSKYVILEFSVQWSGYGGQSSPGRALGVEYRKVSREIAAKTGSFFSHRFSDNTSNDWHIRQVPKIGKNKSAGYGHQVDEYLKSL